jgi:3-deoxy-D-manno-octulosonic-acid transferase
MKLLIYRLLIAPAMTIAVFLIAPFHSKLRSVLMSKMKSREPFAPDFPPVWIHASSGEFEYAKSVIREIKTAEPRTPIVVTYSSATYVKAIENFPGVDASLPLPLDLPGPCRSFLRKMKPKYLLIARTDLWPEMLHQAQAFHVPVVLFAYTQREPKQMPWPARALRRWLLGYVSQIQCVSEQDAKNVKALGVYKPAVVLGDPRYDQVQFRLKNPRALPEQLKPSRPALVAGSTWPQDEMVLVAGLAPILKAKKLQLVLVPHEPTPSHLKAIESRLGKAGLSFKRYSRQESWAECDVLVVDQTGVLAELYQWSTMAFVGGSFKSTVHSVMEPLGAGSVTLVGPYYRNNREALEFVNVPAGPFTAVQVCSDAQSLGRTVELLLGPHEARKQQILTAFQSRLGSGRRIFDSLFAISAERSNSAGPADRGLSLQN